jgi:16S rRNA (adenine1518-N6/adenine1519-N6)-dimethyltransferase
MVKPKKHLGQHFLTDTNVAEKIVKQLSPDTKSLIEIGPGTGVLTKIILEKNIPDFYVIDIDRESIEYLNKNYPELKDNIISADFLNFNLSDIFTNEFSILGNFPYNISSQILFKVLDYRKQVTEVVGMFQKEVAERIASPPGNKTYGILSVLIQAFYDIEYLFTVSEGVFFPPPKVKSAVIRLKRNNTKNLGCSEKLFFEVVKLGFGQRRKTLRNCLKKFQFANKEMELLSKRAEQLGVHDFVELTNSIILK